MQSGLLLWRQFPRLLHDTENLFGGGNKWDSGYFRNSDKDSDTTMKRPFDLTFRFFLALCFCALGDPAFPDQPKTDVGAKQLEDK